MKLYITRIPGVRGFVGTTWAVRKEGGYILKIFLSKKEAEDYAKEVSEI